MGAPQGAPFFFLSGVGCYGSAAAAQVTAAEDVVPASYFGKR